MAIAKKTKKKTSKKKIVKKAPVKKAEDLGKKVGKIVHYYTNLKVGIIELTSTLKVGDKIKIKGATSDFEQKVDSMQIEHDKVQEAKKGKSIGLKVKKPVRQNDIVYLV